MSVSAAPDVSRYFADDGPLARVIPGFRARPQQLEMANAIAGAIQGNRVLVAEAGTGTGKTFAYLVPALVSGGKVIISTGTKTLQDQLFHRDLPEVRKALKVPVTTALLKGRANYACHYHAQRAVSEGRFITREDAGYIRQVIKWMETSSTGDKAECTGVPEDATVWLSATSTRENCLGQDCPNAKECFVMGARRAAQEADVVVVNHHLFFADVMLRDTGMAELLPACNTVIFDEAHQLPETASLFFGESASTAQLLELARDTRHEGLAHARDFTPLQDATRALEKAARDLRLAIPGENARLGWDQLEPNKDFHAALDELEEQLAHFVTLTESQAERDEALQRCWQRATEMHERVTRWRRVDEPDVIRWVEVFSQSASLNLTPLKVGDIFRKQVEGNAKAWVFTSATLAVGKDFGHYNRDLGLAWLEPPPQTEVWGSPFDYGAQGLLYAPSDMPDPNSMDYADAVVEKAFPLIRAARGRTFVLCTSLRAMQRIHEGIDRKLFREGLDFPLLLQGQGSRSELLARFRDLGNAVLVASQSFWEGVDVPGDALSVVVIDKLPFSPPDDPVLKARVAWMEKQGRNPFMEYQLPRAVINMKQGAGRLIRTERDRGVLMVCDPRMITKPYGKMVWRSLPPMSRSRVEEEVVTFLEKLPPPKDPGGLSFSGV
ncbi:ATP-dependent DNA helicase [Uliginosibacterium sp. H1]|uniref:ATP-dependent DNA helicase n=1 Tax=Uliginosibacterium sp. H1 TaxID=3114757 RepID=UPI002E179339|nr:ATP-dependent DNA helicase [Uliginosibacterium sp. H1]